MSITLNEANTLVDTALAKARDLKLNPLCIAVLDPGGHVVVLKREDGAGILRPQIAVGKAWGCLGMGIGTRTMEARFTTRPTFLTALVGLAEGNVVPVAGGVLLKRNGHVVGAVGVTGDTSDNDETCALAGAAAVGLEAVV